MNDLLKNAGNYVLSFGLVVLGAVLLNVYLKGTGLEVQGKGMLIGGILMIVIGILSLPIVMSKLSKPIRWALTLVALVGVVTVAMGVYKSIKTEIDFQNEFAEYNASVIQKMKDLREAENAFAKINNRYTDDIDGELVDFLNADVIPVPDSEGMFIEATATSDPDADPDDIIGVGNGSEQTYREKGYIIKYKDLDSVATMLGMNKDVLLQKIREDEVNYKIRDTSYVSLYSQKFAPEIREKRIFLNWI